MKSSIERLKQECSLVADGLLTPKASFTTIAAKALLESISANEDALIYADKTFQEGRGPEALAMANAMAAFSTSAIESIRETFAASGG